MWGEGCPRAKFVSKKKSESETNDNKENSIFNHAFKLLRSEAAQVDGQLMDDFQKVMEGEAIYLPELFCGRDDMGIVRSLLEDISGEEGLVDWSKHLKLENPQFSSTFQRIVHALDVHFDVQVIATRLNFYRDGSDWKPFHHDSHAYCSTTGLKEDFTMGASFGASRELEFKHPPSGHAFAFPQHNGDVFAFTSEVNSRFMHGVPKARKLNIGPRFSIIAWGRRRTLNKNNGGPKHIEPSSSEEERRSLEVQLEARRTQAGQSTEETKAASVSMTEVSNMVKNFLQDQELKNSMKQKRLSGGPRSQTESYNPQQDSIQKNSNTQCNPNWSMEKTVYPVTKTGSHRALVKELKRELGSKYLDFQNLSVSFQHGDVEIAHYCDQACALLGDRLDLLQKAADWLPVKTKQNELMSQLRSIEKSRRIISSN